MDVAVGHFGRMEFMSSDLAFPFTRDVANLARVMVRKTKEGILSGDPTSGSSQSSMEQVEVNTSFDTVNDVRRPGLNSPIYCNLFAKVSVLLLKPSQFESGGMIDFYTEDWSTMLPLFDQGSTAGLYNQFNSPNVRFFSGLDDG